MAVSERIEAEAQRTIAGIQEFYRDLGNGAGSKEEMEHRIRRVEAVKEGCNGLTQEEKVQKTAENLFELTCAQERLFDSVRREIWDVKNIVEENKEEFKNVRQDIKELKGLIEESCVDSVPKPRSKKNWPFSKIIAENPGWSFLTFIFILILAFVSGHFEFFSNLFTAAKPAIGGQ